MWAKIALITVSVATKPTLNTRLEKWKELLFAHHSVIILKVMSEFVYFQTGILMKLPHKERKMAFLKQFAWAKLPSVGKLISSSAQRGTQRVWVQKNKENKRSNSHVLEKGPTASLATRDGEQRNGCVTCMRIQAVLITLQYRWWHQSISWSAEPRGSWIKLKFTS